MTGVQTCYLPYYHLSLFIPNIYIYIYIFFFSIYRLGPNWIHYHFRIRNQLRNEFDYSQFEIKNNLNFYKLNNRIQLIESPYLYRLLTPSCIRSMHVFTRASAQKMDRAKNTRTHSSAQSKSWLLSRKLQANICRSTSTAKIQNIRLLAWPSGPSPTS